MMILSWEASPTLTVFDQLPIKSKKRPLNLNEGAYDLYELWWTRVFTEETIFIIQNLPEFGSITPVSSELTVGGIEVERDTLFKLCIKAMGRLSIYFLLVDNIIKQTLTSLQA